MSKQKPLVLAVGAAVSALAALSAAPTIAQQENDTIVEQVIVTGTRLTKSNISSPVPLIQIGTEEIANRGVARIEEIVNLLPNVFVDQTSQVANGTSGISSLDLRGLDAERTLVLLDGKRLPFGSPLDAAVNVDIIPAALVERVDVITSGASAVYGSDAVAGVVNFITKRDFEGFEVNVQSGVRQNPNDNNFMADVLRRSGIEDPGAHTGGEDYLVSAIMGLNSSDGRGNITLFASYQQQRELVGANRDTGACTLGGTATINCVGSSNFRRFNTSNGQGALFQQADGTLIPLTGGPAQTYNFGARNHYQRPVERWNLNASGHYEIADGIEAYMDFGFMHNNTTAQIAESASFNRSFRTNCNNPLLAAGRGPNGTGRFSFGDFLGTGRGASFVSCNQLLADGNPGNDATEVTFINSHRNVEGGPRASTYENNTFRFVTGLRGDISEDFAFDVFAQYARNRGEDISQRDLNFRRVQQALFIVRGPNGNPVCRDSSGGCVPWNIFERTPDGQTRVTNDAVKFIQGTGIVTGTTEQLVLGGTLEGDFSRWGIALPWANDGLTSLLGVEYREDSLERIADDISQIPGGRGLTGTGGATLPVAGDIDVFEIFGEFELPIIQDAPFVQELGLKAGYRWSDYTTAGLDPQTRAATSNDFTADTYFVGASYTPLDDLRFRANFSRAIRAPNVFDLFIGANTGLTDLSTGENGLFDPCASGPDASGNTGITPRGSLEACARTGVTRAQYGNIEDNPAGQYNIITGGNAQLEPETADTVTFGVVFTPRFVEGLSVTLDWFDIEVTDAIDQIPAQASLDGCIAGGPSANVFCSLIQRDTFGTLWLSSDAPGGRVAGISQQNQNIASIETRGIDLGITYALDMNRWGFFSLDYSGTFLNTLAETPFKGAAPIECAGFYAGQCELPSPEYRHRMLATWDTPMDDISVIMTWRHIGETTLFGLDKSAAAQRREQMNDYLEARNYVDLSVTYNFNDSINLRAGINNVFAKDAPLSTSVGTGTGNNNTYPGLFDTSRTLFAGATFRF